MNRQQRRKQEREMKKVANLFSEGQHYNNCQWAIRIERLREVKGVGPATMEKIIKTVQAPLTGDEKDMIEQMYRGEFNANTN